MCEQKFCLCGLCKNMISFVKDNGPPLMCCGMAMEVLVENTQEASEEKHLPSVSISGNTVKVQVGSILHPMTDEHYIQFICLKTQKGSQCKCLKPGDQPVAEFVLTDDKAVAVYEYCNLHGLWKTDVK